jgi:hypothetical protein
MTFLSKAIAVVLFYFFKFVVALKVRAVFLETEYPPNFHNTRN